MSASRSASSAEAIASLAKEGAGGAASLDDFVAKLNPPRAAWLMVPAPAVDGRPMFSGPSRTMAVVEHARPVYDIGDPDAVEPGAGDPPSYTALRGAGWMFVSYATGEVGYYDLVADPHQLHNIAAGLTPARLAELQAAVVANTTCAGAVQCGAAQER